MVNFKGENWKNKINVEDFIINNYKEYLGDDCFLETISDKTKKVLTRVEELTKEELEKGILDVETNIISGIDNFQPGYIDKKMKLLSVCKRTGH